MQHSLTIILSSFFFFLFVYLFLWTIFLLTVSEDLQCQLQQLLQKVRKKELSFSPSTFGFVLCCWVTVFLFVSIDECGIWFSGLIVYEWNNLFKFCHRDLLFKIHPGTTAREVTKPKKKKFYFALFVVVVVYGVLLLHRNFSGLNFIIRFENFYRKVVKIQILTINQRKHQFLLSSKRLKVCHV